MPAIKHVLITLSPNAFRGGAKVLIPAGKTFVYSVGAHAMCVSRDIDKRKDCS